MGQKWNRSQVENWLQIKKKVSGAFDFVSKINLMKIPSTSLANEPANE